MEERKKIHTVISIDAEKEFDKIQHSFMIKKKKTLTYILRISIYQVYIEFPSKSSNYTSLQVHTEHSSRFCHMLSQKTSLSKLKKVKIMSSIYSDQKT